jgi:hypothetical protein
MSTSDQTNSYQLRDAYYAALHRDVMVYEALDDVLSQLALPSQGLRSLCHDELSADAQAHMLRAVARLAADSGMIGVFELVLANVALARRDWPLIAELGIRGISYDANPPHLFPDGTVVTRLTQPAYYASATWHFENRRWIPRIHGEGRIEQVARHLVTSLIAIAAMRASEPGAEQ